MTPLAATVLVTTRDRCEDLARLLASVERQEGEIEVVVIDDGSTDGTAAMVERRHPQVRLIRSERSLGLIAQRNRGTREARGEIVVSVDDDAELRHPATVMDTVTDFCDPRIGAVAIPFVDVPRGPEVRQRAPDRERVWVSPIFRGTAYAVRRDVFLALGGFRESLQQVAEEMDFCLRLLGAGYVVRAGTAEPLHHLESPRRSRPRIAYLDRRNNVLHAWRNVPAPYLPVRLAKIVAETPLLVRDHRHPVALVRGLGAGLAALRRRADRRPVPRSTYRLDHELRRRGPLPLDEIADGLGPPLLASPP